MGNGTRLCVSCKMWVDSVTQVDQLCPTCDREAKKKPKPFTLEDLQKVRALAIEAYKQTPFNVQLPGSDRPLTGEEFRIAMIAEATISVLVANGYLKLSPNHKIIDFVTIDNEPIL